ncbi:MAG: T9SS type A sorting domain-containing protein [Candidatus Eisenbacteria bacterium]|nr:T9SS type A sorting domain-containing protein [Candidatus Eisenbacteria bacterium]
MRYGLRRPGEMHLAIYDVGGREVAKVYDGYARAKIDNATVDLSRLSSGVYFARLESGGTTVTRRVVVER